MGTTLWIQTLEERNYSGESDDHSLMSRHLEALDGFCEQAGVRRLSDFLDYTDQQFSADLDAEDDEDLDPDTDLGYGIDDMDWFDAAEGLATLQALESALERQGLPGFDEDECGELREEIRDCIAVLESLSAGEGKFHLAVID